MCIFDNCIKQPNFNLPNEKKRLYCLEHKRCNFVNCIKISTFNLPTEKKHYIV